MREYEIGRMGILESEKGNGVFPGSSDVNNSEVDNTLMNNTLMNNTHMRSMLVNHSVIDCCVLGWIRAFVRRLLSYLSQPIN